MFAPASFFILIVLTIASGVDSSIPRSSLGRTTSSPLSAKDKADADERRSRPAWNASPRISTRGYLRELYHRVPGEWESACPHLSDEMDVPAMIRQVPGDGDCLFHAVAMSLRLIRDGRHLRMDNSASMRELKDASRRLRCMAVECLRSCEPDPVHRRPRERRAFLSRSHHGAGKRYKRLFIQGCESMSTSNLLSTAAGQYGISPREYCDLMEQDSYWGGGPEIVALVNVLKRPIHVYELVPAADVDEGVRTRGSSLCDGVQALDHLFDKRFVLRLMAAFGWPRYNSMEPLRILSADSRFPDVLPDRIKENGNHFMAIFPVDTMKRWVNATKESSDPSFHCDQKRRVRGGASGDAESCGEAKFCRLEAPYDSWMLHGEWFDNFDYSADLEADAVWEIDQCSSSGGSWCQKLLRLPQQLRWQSTKHFVGFLIKVFVWTASHFHIGL